MSGNINEKEADERVVEIEVERLRDFHNHPFKVTEDQQMDQLIDSIRKFGILNPLIVRPVPDGVYEIISGHRRKYASQKLGYRKLPVIIRVLENNDAIVSMVDSNLHREMIKPSEKAFAYMMKYDALKRKSGRRKEGQNDYDYRGKKTLNILGEESDDSPKQIQRYLKIAELVTELLERLDDGGIAFNPAFEAAFLRKDEQRMLLEAMDYAQSSPSISQAQRMKQLSREGKLTLNEMQHILSEVKKGEINRVMFKNEQLYQYFPRNYTAEQRRKKSSKY